MRVGKLRHRIIIQQANEVQGSYGEPVQTWATFAEVWAAIRPLKGRELFLAKEKEARIDSRIIIRYLAGVTAKMRILFGTRIFQIVNIINEEERNVSMQLICWEKDI